MLNNSRKFFSELNSLTGKSDSKPKLLLKNDDGNIIDDPQTLADLFNHKFTTMGNPDSPYIPVTEADIRCFDKCMFFFLVTETEVVLKINRLKSHTSCSLDGFSAEILKVCSPVISNVLANLIKASLSTGQFAKCLKTA